MFPWGDLWVGGREEKGGEGGGVLMHSHVEGQSSMSLSQLCSFSQNPARTEATNTSVLSLTNLQPN